MGVSCNRCVQHQRFVHLNTSRQASVLMEVDSPRFRLGPKMVRIQVARCLIANFDIVGEKAYIFNARRCHRHQRSSSRRRRLSLLPGSASVPRPGKKWAHGISELGVQ